MPRDVDERKKRAALRKLRKAAALAEQGLGPPLSDWEQEFLEEVEARIETYGSAFADLEKGAADEPLSALQKVKLREIDKKARGKGKTGFKSRRSSFRKKDAPKRAYSRDINDDLEDAPPPEPGDLSSPTDDVSPKQKGRPVFRVIDGGKSELND